MRRLSQCRTIILLVAELGHRIAPLDMLYQVIIYITSNWTLHVVINYQTPHPHIFFIKEKYMNRVRTYPFTTIDIFYSETLVKYK